MTKIAFKPLRHGRNLKVIAFPLPGGEALLEQTYPFDGAAIQDDENAPIITPDNRTSDPLKTKRMRYNFDMFGIVGDRTTPVQQVKSTIAYRVTAEKKPIKQTV